MNYNVNVKAGNESHEIQKISKSILAEKALKGDVISREELIKIANNKQLCIYSFLKSVKQLSSNNHIYYGEISGIPIIVDAEKDAIYRDGRHKCKLVDENGELYAVNKIGERLMICNKDGEFDFTRFKFADGITTVGTGNYKAIELCTENFGHIKIRCHYLIVAVTFGCKVLDCIGYGRLFDINHKDANKRNNRYDNLEIITHKENIDHFYSFMYE